MSNKIVPSVYRSIIDEVIGSLKPDFDEFGVGDEVLGTLRQKWEQRVVASRAADFSDPQPTASNPNSSHFTGIGAAATNNATISRTSSPNINRTNSPASMAHSRGASRTNSIGASSMNQSVNSSFSQPNYPPTSAPTNQGNGMTQVKVEPVDRYTPSTLGGNANSANQPAYPYSSMHGQVSQHMPVPGVPNLNLSGYSQLPPMNQYASRNSNYGGMPTGPVASTRQQVLMLPRNAAPQNMTVAGNNPGGKLPQVDGAWDEDAPEGQRREKRSQVIKRYPWMANAPMPNLDALIMGGGIPQVDGPTPATPPVPPLNILPPLNLPSSSGSISRTGGPPPLTLPPLNLPPDLPSGSKTLHPSLVNRNPQPASSDPEVKKEEKEPDLKRVPSTVPAVSSSFARNPNVPAQPSEDINSDLDDSDEEEGPHEQPGSDPDADVTYCTYDKVTRVKTKWKVVFRDGMVHANGKDYLFGRCTGEFDW